MFPKSYITKILKELMKFNFSWLGYTRENKVIYLLYVIKVSVQKFVISKIFIYYVISAYAFWFLFLNNRYNICWNYIIVVFILYNYALKSNSAEVLDRLPPMISMLRSYDYKHTTGGYHFGGKNSSQYYPLTRLFILNRHAQKSTIGLLTPNWF